MKEALFPCPPYARQRPRSDFGDKDEASFATTDDRVFLYAFDLIGLNDDDMRRGLARFYSRQRQLSRQAGSAGIQ